MLAAAGSGEGGPAEPRPRVWFAHAIRGPACLLVVFAHLFDLFPRSQAVVAPIGHFQPLGGLPAVPWRGVVDLFARHGLTPGPIGVLLFFLVSGFVIPLSLEQGTPRGFFLRRFFRLYPTLWACLLVTLAVLTVQAHLLGSAVPFGARAVGGSALLVSPYTRLPWIEPVFWSLAIEEIFYALAATAAWRHLLSSRAVLLLAAGGLAAACAATRHAAVAGPLFWLSFNLTFVVFILIGVVLHHFHQRIWRPVESVAMTAAIFGTYAFALHHGTAAQVASQYIPSAVVALLIFGGLLLMEERLPYSSLLDRLSNISYPLYLLHGVNGYVVTRAVFLLTGSYYAGVAVAVATAVLAAAAMHHLVEGPTNDLGRRLARRLRRQPGAPPPDRLPVPAQGGRGPVGMGAA